MCGIAGAVLPDVSADDRRRVIDAMCDAIAHRGPDGGGVFVSGAAAIGMRRLAIVDVDHGNQPMLGRGGDIALVFNGEIYNAPELREQLESEGVAFDTRSDTEVILRLYERNPDDVEAHLRGMWGFAILDVRRGRLVLSRDRFGIKPLFLLRTARALVFGSELRVMHLLRRWPGFAPALEVDPEAAHAMMSWGFVPNERTIHRGVTRVAPATRITIDLATFDSREHRYWVPRPSPETARARSVDDAAAIVRPLLRESVRMHLRADMECGVFLSGGIDSSLVSAYAAQEADYAPKAFTIGFDEERFDESPAARATAARLGLPAEVIRLGGEDAPHVALDALRAYDEPFGDSSAVAVYVLSRAAARERKVVLAGDGGDEGFAGYRKHAAVGVRAALDRVPGARALAHAMLSRIPPSGDRSTRWSVYQRRLARLAQAVQKSDGAAYRALTQVEGLSRTAAFMRAPAGPALERELEAAYERAAGGALERTLTTDTTNTLPNDLLTKVDRASMRFGLEVRVPFLDHLVFEAGLGVRARLSLGGGGKRVLRHLAATDVGREIAGRPKRGFEVPVEAWMRGPLVPACDAAFERSTLERHGLLDPAVFGAGRWRELASAQGLLLWNALALSAWCDAWQMGPALAPRVVPTFDGQRET